MIIDEIKLAETLEKKHLWRRAARQWLVVFDQLVDAESRHRAAMRRQICLRRSTSQSVCYSGLNEHHLHAEGWHQ
ncbi:PerC family transcriptional regulator [Dickeya fangzhongdai]|uniref:PerC family transcriptional regulator n=1 Tax=Dickeya fangzhongdai TaxID=1778540 RepID=UPI001ADB1A87|nr:PerC family transcriptional regulator [Dickeya fangzhongdai]MBO8132480.1 PerC family transcriptional regulator [Dickeya fangzhongdai]